VAPAAALGVTEPYSAGIGGGGYFVYYDAESRTVRTIDGDRRLGDGGSALRGGWRRRPHRHHSGRDRQDRQIPCDRATHPHLQGKAVRAA
jgi:hypothetical protein